MGLSKGTLSGAVLVLILSIVPTPGTAQQAPAGTDARVQQSRELVAQAEAAGKAGDNAKAIALYGNALSLREAALGTEHATLVPILDALGALHRQAKNYPAALAYYQRSLSIDEKTLGRTHPDVAADLRNLSEVYRAMGDEEKARASLERSETIDRASASDTRYPALMRRAPPPAAPPVASVQPQVELPNFPWPPPTPSTQSSLSNALFQSSGSRQTSLSDVGNRLVKVLEQARYFEYSYYRVPNGFALVARLERIGVDGTPMPEEFRFLAPGSQEPFSLGVYVRQLFFAPAGFYRQIVFAVTGQPFTTTAEKLDARTAQRLLSGGANRLSNDYESAPFTAQHTVTVLIYEFSKGAKEGDVSTLIPGRLGARTHLERAGIFSALAPSK